MKTKLIPVALSLAAAWSLLHSASAASSRASGLATRADVPALIATLQKPDATLQQKALACQQLAIVGTAEAIPALVGLLDHPQLAVQARNVLQNLSGPEAGAALRAALPRLQGPYLVGVVNSLGLRRDAEAVEPLLALEKNPLQGFWPETLLALGRIASPTALAALRETAERGPHDRIPAAAEACLLAGEALFAAGNASRAAEFYDLARKIAPIPPLQLAAQRGAILARGDEGIPLLLEQFRSPAPAVQQLAARVARELPGPAVSHALAAELAKASDPVRVLLLGALNDRAEPGLASAVEPLATSASPEVRLAALQALGSLGTSSSVSVLLQALGAAAGSSPPETEAISDSLSRLRGSDVDAALLQALPGTPTAVRAQLISVLGYRNAPNATEALLAQAAAPDPVVSKAAFNALAAVSTLEELPRVIHVAVHRADPEVRDLAERSVYGICLKQQDAARRSEPLAKAFAATTAPAARNSLLQIMAMLGDAAASRAIATACEDPSPEIRDAALRLLVNWPDASPVPTLLKIYKATPNDVHRTLALRGIVTLSTLWAGDSGSSPRATRRPPAEAVQWLTEANAAVRPVAEEKKLVLSGLGDLNCEAGLKLLAPYLDDPMVRQDAELAALRAIKNLNQPAERAAARPLLEKIADGTQDADVRRQAEEALKAGAPKS